MSQELKNGKQSRISRRDFLSISGSVVGVLLYTSTPIVLKRFLNDGSDVTSEPQIELDRTDDHLWVFGIDVNKCIGCGRCIKACKMENHVPLDKEESRTWIERYEVDEAGKVRANFISNWKRETVEKGNSEINNGDSRVEASFYVPKLCNQCSNPPCVRVCPVSATFKTKEGVVLVDGSRCVGCKYCIQACPFGARFLHAETKVVDKCTWCYHRITKGMSPACVEVCPTQARSFGDWKVPDSSVRKLINGKTVQVLKPELGTKPRVYYVGLREGIV